MLRPPVARELLIVLALMFANGLFAGAEIAVLSVRKTRLAEYARRGDRRALAVKALRQKPETFLATVQIGMTVIGTTAAAFGGHSIAETIEPYMVDAGLGSYSYAAAFTIVIVFIALLELVVAEQRVAAVVRGLRAHVRVCGRRRRVGEILQPRVAQRLALR